MGLNNDTGEFFAVKQVGLTKDEGLKGKQKGHVLALEAEVAVLKLLRCVFTFNPKGSGVCSPSTQSAQVCVHLQPKGLSSCNLLKIQK
jgi:hypothetical protein